jgi:hypothetical protein
VSDDGSVILAEVMDVLERNGTEISTDANKADMFLLVKGDLIETVHIPERCGRQLVRYLSRKFTTPIHHFYNPMMAPQKPDETVQ